MVREKEKTVKSLVESESPKDKEKFCFVWVLVFKGRGGQIR